MLNAQVYQPAGLMCAQSFARCSCPAVNSILLSPSRLAISWCMHLHSGSHQFPPFLLAILTTLTNFRSQQVPTHLPIHSIGALSCSGDAQAGPLSVRKVRSFAVPAISPRLFPLRAHGFLAENAVTYPHHKGALPHYFPHSQQLDIPSFTCRSAASAHANEVSDFTTEDECFTSRPQPFNWKTFRITRKNH